MDGQEVVGWLNAHAPDFCGTEDEHSGPVARRNQARRSKPRYSWTERTAAEPSPTAAATRLVDPERTSPTANNPGRLVSNGSGARPSVFHAPLRCSRPSDRSVSTKPRSSRAAEPDSHCEAGSAPINENSAVVARSSSPSGPLIQTALRK